MTEISVLSEHVFNVSYENQKFEMSKYFAEWESNIYISSIALRVLILFVIKNKKLKLLDYFTKHFPQTTLVP